MLRTAAAVALSAGIATPALAQTTFVFQGQVFPDGDNAWNLSQNWGPFGVPTLNDIAVIPTGFVANTSGNLGGNSNGPGGQAGTLRIQAGAGVRLGRRNGEELRVGPSIENFGFIDTGGSVFSGIGKLQLTTDLSLTGTGVVRTNGKALRIFGTSGSEVFTNVSNDMSGQFEFLVDAVNASTITINRQESFFNRSLTNDGLLRVQNAGSSSRLELRGDVDNTNGRIEVRDGLRLAVEPSARVTGGEVAAINGSSIYGTFENVRFSGNHSIGGNSNPGRLSLVGDIENTGSITGGNGSFDIRVFGELGLSGGGLIQLGSGARLGAGDSNAVITQNDNNLRVFGSGGFIDFYYRNGGEINVDANSTLTVQTVDNTDTTITFADRGQLAINGEIFGGTLVSQAGRTRINGRLRDISLRGTFEADRRLPTFTIAGDIDNGGSIVFDSSVFSATEKLGLAGRVNLAGGGEILMSGGSAEILQVSGSGGLTNIDNTIRGTGQINTLIENHGLIRSEGGPLTINQDVTGTGDMVVTGGTTLAYNAAFLQQGSITVEPGGTFDFNGSRMEVTDYTGSLTQDFAVFAPGASPAISNITGDFTQTSTSNILEIELGGTTPGLYDQLIIGGNASILGSLDVHLIDGFTLTGGLTFDILEVDGSFTGQFLGLGEGDLVGTFGDVDLFITYIAGDGNNVSLIAVPAPGSIAVLGMTGLLVGRRRRA